ncbi:hypothetical protein [Streptosporangium roseum]|uniref:hypothetical protein n=1 Tax=Streptosporangium roseum TaxID=2001 RepID=UPI0012DCBD70|nr:hypothetical protein [Streptosporangium roseum]
MAIRRGWQKPPLEVLQPTFTAYGLAHAGSDVNQLGIYAPPTLDLVGLGRLRAD